MSDALSYVSSRHAPWQRWLIRAIETASGRQKLLPLYERWRLEVAGKSPRMMSEALAMIGTTLDIRGPGWPADLAPGEPLVLVANHPYGIGDGLAALAIAEMLGRPYRILINSEFMRVPEFRPFALPIDFSETPEAVEVNLKSRAEARRLLKEGVTIVVFPAGGVATADDVVGAAEELPWKTFAARLIQQAQASVLPVHFRGQNSALFHFVSRYSLLLRLSLLVSEFRTVVGGTITADIGPVVRFSALECKGDRRALTDELYVLVHRLAPSAGGLPASVLLPRDPGLRRRYPWDREPAAPKSAPPGSDRAPYPTRP